MTRMPDAVEMDVVAGPGAEGARRATGGPGYNVQLRRDAVTDVL